MKLCNLVFVWLIFLCRAYLDRQTHNETIQLNQTPIIWHGFLKNMVVDWYWFSFLQSDLNQLNAFALSSWGHYFYKQDPHFTCVYRLISMCLISRFKEYDLAIDLLSEALKSPVNQSDWRMYGYLMQAHRSKSDQQSVINIKNKLERIPEACKLIALQMPVRPDYI